jgi:two-component system response regulator PilR (NtrC family)
VRPIGEQRETPVDVRVLSATHRNLTSLVAEGAFREDLYYRINVIEIRVPALRERPEDIPELAEAILRRLARRTKVDAPELGPDAVNALCSYKFPGNVRELENILERAMALSGGNAISATDLQLRDVSVSAGSTEAGSGPLGEQLEEIEREAIIKALEQTRYNKTAAAKLLGVSFRALRYRIKKLGIE